MRTTTCSKHRASNSIKCFADPPRLMLVFVFAVLLSMTEASSPFNRTSYLFTGGLTCNSTAEMADYKAHAEDITGIILYTYVIKNGTLSPNPRFPPGQCIDHFADWVATGIDIFAAIAMKYVDDVLKSPEAEKKFIDGAIGNALKHGLKGYNVDKEG